MSADEWLYRIIPNDINFYKATLDQPVLRTAFDPSRSDVDGLSLYREDFVHFKSLAKWYFRQKNKRCYIARLRASEIIAVGASFNMTVSPSPDAAPNPPGHAVIPEFTFASVKAQRQAAKEIQRKLAEIACANIVHQPPTPRKFMASILRYFRRHI